MADFSRPSDAPIVAVVNGTPIKARPEFWLAPLSVTGLLAVVAGLRHPERSAAERLAFGLIAMPVALMADVGHAIAHTASARVAGAPMDEILLGLSMPRTLYFDDEALPPRTHITRSLGGPIYSTACLLFGLVWRMLAPRGSVSRELADVVAVSNGVIWMGSLTPLPIVDAGIILRWSLIERGQTPQQADAAVQRASLTAGLAAAGAGAGLAVRRRTRWAGVALIAGAAACLAAAFGWLK